MFFPAANEIKRKKKYLKKKTCGKLTIRPTAVGVRRIKPKIKSLSTALSYQRQRVCVCLLVCLCKIMLICVEILGTREIFYKTPGSYAIDLINNSHVFS